MLFFPPILQGKGMKTCLFSLFSPHETQANPNLYVLFHELDMLPEVLEDGSMGVYSTKDACISSSASPSHLPACVGPAV